MFQTLHRLRRPLLALLSALSLSLAFALPTMACTVGKPAVGNQCRNHCHEHQQRPCVYQAQR